MGIFDNFIYKDGEIIDNSWVKWFHWGVPDEEGEERERQRKQLAFSYIVYVAQRYRDVILRRTISRKSTRIVIVANFQFRNR